MRSRLVAIGNSRGIRLPKTMIEDAGLTDEVDIVVRNREIVVKSADVSRAGWEDAAALANRRGEDALVDEPGPTKFDDEDWDW